MYIYIIIYIYIYIYKCIERERKREREPPLAPGRDDHRGGPQGLLGLGDALLGLGHVGLVFGSVFVLFGLLLISCCAYSYMCVCLLLWFSFCCFLRVGLVQRHGDREAGAQEAGHEEVEVVLLPVDNYCLYVINTCL